MGFLWGLLVLDVLLGLAGVAIALQQGRRRRAAYIAIGFGGVAVLLAVVLVAAASEP